MGTMEGRTALVTGAQPGHRAGDRAEPGRPGRARGRDRPQARRAGRGGRVAGRPGGGGRRRRATPATPEHRAEAVRTAVETFGSLDMLVGNVGVNPVYGPMVDLDLDAFRKILDTNVVSSLGLVQEAWRAWMAEHGGSVLFVASVAGLRSSENIGAYGVSKAAVINLTTQLAVELGPDGAGQRGRPGGGEDPVRRGAVRGPRGRGGRASTRPAGSACRRTSARPRPTCSATAPAGSPGRRWCSTAGGSPSAADSGSAAPSTRARTSSDSSSSR